MLNIGFLMFNNFCFIIVSLEVWECYIIYSVVMNEFNVIFGLIF